MIDTLNGRRMGMASSGSSRRQSYKYEPTSRMSNTYIAPGTDTLEDMLKGIERGLYAKKDGEAASTLKRENSILRCKKAI